MFDHRNMATDGLFPGLVSTFSIAVLGTLEFQVQIFEEQPTQSTHRSGGTIHHSSTTNHSYGNVGHTNNKYSVQVTVSHKGRQWHTKQYAVNGTAAKVLAKVLKVAIQPKHTVTAEHISSTELPITVEASFKENT